MYQAPPSAPSWLARRFSHRTSTIITAGAIAFLLNMGFDWIVTDILIDDVRTAPRSIAWNRFWTLPARILFFSWMAAIFGFACHRALVRWRWVDCFVLLAALGGPVVFLRSLPFW